MYIRRDAACHVRVNLHIIKPLCTADAAGRIPTDSDLLIQPLSAPAVRWFGPFASVSKDLLCGFVHLITPVFCVFLDLLRALARLDWALSALRLRLLICRSAAGWPNGWFFGGGKYAFGQFFELFWGKRRFFEKNLAKNFFNRKITFIFAAKNRQ